MSESNSLLVARKLRIESKSMASKMRNFIQFYQRKVWSTVLSEIWFLENSRKFEVYTTLLAQSCEMGIQILLMGHNFVQIAMINDSFVNMAIKEDQTRKTSIFYF